MKTATAELCKCGKPIRRDDATWVHTATGSVDCFNAAIYVGYVATPADRN